MGNLPTVAIYGADLLAGGLAVRLVEDCEVFLLDGAKNVFPDRNVYPAPQEPATGGKKLLPAVRTVKKNFPGLEFSEDKQVGYMVKRSKEAAVEPKLTPDLEDIDFESISAAECREREKRISTYLNEIEFAREFYYRRENKIWKKFLDSFQGGGGRLIPEHKLEFDRENEEWILEGENLPPVDKLIFTGTWPENQQNRRQLFAGGRVLKEVWINVDVSVQSPPDYPWFNQNIAIFPAGNEQLIIRGFFLSREGATKIKAGEVLEMVHKSYEVFPFIYEEKLGEIELRFRYLPEAGTVAVERINDAPAVYLAAGYSGTGLEILPELLELVSD